MVESPLITCVIPTYRRPRMLSRAIKSVLSQTFTNISVVVTDNASGDETAEVVHAIQAQDSRVTYHCHSENLGMHANFVYGMSCVKTPFFSLLSDDDLLLPDFYRQAYAAFQQNPEAMMVATKVPHVTETGRFIMEPLAQWDRNGLFNPPSGAHRVAAIRHPELMGILFRQELLSTPYGYPPPHIFGGDFEMILKTSLYYPIVTIDCEGALFVQHSGPRALPQDLFSVFDNYREWILTVDQDDRFPPLCKDAHRKKVQKTILRESRGLFIHNVLNGDRKGVEKALEIRTNNFGDTYIIKIFKLTYWFCYTFPMLRPILRYIYNLLKRFKYIIRQFNYPLVDKYRVYLDKYY